MSESSPSDSKIKALFKSPGKLIGILVFIAAIAGGGVYLGKKMGHAPAGHEGKDGKDSHSSSGSHSGDSHSDEAHSEKNVHGEAASDFHGDSHHGKASQGAKGKWAQLVSDYTHLFSNVQTKVESLQRAEVENSKLRLENTYLRTQLEALRFENRSKEAQEFTKSLGKKFSHEAGSRLARTLANISYKVPSNLLPSQLFPLAVSYFKANEDEKAVVIMSFLTSLEEDDTFKTPRNFLMNGVAWYRLDNLELADAYFEKVLQVPESPDILQFQAQARLWRGLVAERMGKHPQAQAWYRDLIDHHPHSTEAAWVNGTSNKPIGKGGASRATASEHSAVAAQH